MCIFAPIIASPQSLGSVRALWVLPLYACPSLYHCPSEGMVVAWLVELYSLLWEAGRGFVPVLPWEWLCSRGINRVDYEVTTS